MSTIRALWVGAVATLGASSAHAWEPSFTSAITSDYDFRGITLSAREPAVQMSFAMTADSGFSAGVWASNVDFGVPDVDVEVDYSVGWSGDTGAVDLSTGVVYYRYPGDHTLDYPELWFGLDKPMTDRVSLGGKLWYSSDYAGVGEAATYLETNAKLGFSAVDLLLHGGYSSGDYWDAAGDGAYVDWSIGVAKSVARWDLAVSLVDGSDLATPPDVDVNSTQRKVVLSFATTLPRN